LINLNLSDFYNWIDLGDYAVALEVVLIVSLGKLFTMSMGCLNNIITNSKYYVYVFWFSTISALLAVVLNLYLIQWYGITGAAYATLMVIVLINILKILLVQYRFKINPYSKASILTVTLILLVNLIFTFIEFDLSPFMALAVRSILIFLVFAVIAHLMKLTTDIQPVLKKILSSFQRT
jgi:O-antigen/teichoic acid export membrane protein